MTEGHPELSKQSFLEQAALLGLSGDDARMDALYEEVVRSLARANEMYGIDTTGIAPSPINPQFDVLA